MGNLKRLVEDTNQAREMIARFGELERKRNQLSRQGLAHGGNDELLNELGNVEKEIEVLRKEITKHLEEIDQPNMIGAPAPWKKPSYTTQAPTPSY